MDLPPVEYRNQHQLSLVVVLLSQLHPQRATPAILSHQNTQNSSYPAEEKDRVTSLQLHETLNGVCLFFSCLIPFNYFIFCRVFAVFLRK